MTVSLHWEMNCEFLGLLLNWSNVFDPFAASGLFLTFGGEVC